MASEQNRPTQIVLCGAQAMPKWWIELPHKNVVSFKYNGPRRTCRKLLPNEMLLLCLCSVYLHIPQNAKISTSSNAHCAPFYSIDEFAHAKITMIDSTPFIFAHFSRVNWISCNTAQATTHGPDCCIARHLDFFSTIQKRFIGETHEAFKFHLPKLKMKLCLCIRVKIQSLKNYLIIIFWKHCEQHRHEILWHMCRYFSCDTIPLAVWCTLDRVFSYQLYVPFSLSIIWVYIFFFTPCVLFRFWSFTGR